MTTANIARVLVEQLPNHALSRDARRRITGTNNRTAPIDAALDSAFVDAQCLALNRDTEAEKDPANLQIHERVFEDGVRKIAEGIQAALHGV